MARTQSSVAQGLGKAHVALFADLGELEQALSPSSAEGLAELRARLGATQAHIAEHFRFEEQNGYMDEVRKREPRLARAIDQLAEEHGQLRDSLDVLIRKANACTSLGEGMREGIRDWTTRVRRHEVRENDLVQDAFNLDIGAED